MCENCNAVYSFSKKNPQTLSTTNCPTVYILCNPTHQVFLADQLVHVGDYLHGLADDEQDGYSDQGDGEVLLVLPLPVVVAVVARAVAAAAVAQVARGGTAAEDARAAPEKIIYSYVQYCVCLFAKLFSSLVLVFFCVDAGLAIF